MLKEPGKDLLLSVANLNPSREVVDNEEIGCSLLLEQVRSDSLPW